MLPAAHRGARGSRGDRGRRRRGAGYRRSDSVAREERRLAAQGVGGAARGQDRWQSTVSSRSERASERASALPPATASPSGVRAVSPRGPTARLSRSLSISPPSRPPRFARASRKLRPGVENPSVVSRRLFRRCCPSSRTQQILPPLCSIDRYAAKTVIG